MALFSLISELERFGILDAAAFRRLFDQAEDALTVTAMKLGSQAPPEFCTGAADRRADALGIWSRQRLNARCGLHQRDPSQNYRFPAPAASSALSRFSKSPASRVRTNLS